LPTGWPTKYARRSPRAGWTARTQSVFGRIWRKKGDEFAGWQGERIARQELQIASGEARSEYAAETNRIEVWQTSEDGRVRDSHAAMNGLWKYPGDKWVVDYSAAGRGVEKEDVPGGSEPGIGCRCQILIRERDDVDSDDYAGTGSP